MKKSTVIILLIVFLGSVLVVGIFGMKSIPYDNIVFMEEITPTSISVSDGETPDILQSEDGTYYVVLSKNKFEDGLKVNISWSTAPLDCTYKDLSVKIITDDINDIPCDPIPERVSQWRGALVFHEPRALRLRFSATDKSHGATMEILIMFSSQM